MNATFHVAEIFYSIQGESTYSGFPCVFVRLAGCNLHCRYCDTSAAREPGTVWTAGAITAEVGRYGCPLVEITGGEPLLQPAVPDLCSKLLETGCQVLLETNGTVPLAGMDRRVVCIMDVKTPSSGEERALCRDNLAWLDEKDQVKFVIAGRSDFEWARLLLAELTGTLRAGILFSPVTPGLDPAELARWLLDSRIRGRLQIQLHKLLQLP